MIPLGWVDAWLVGLAASVAMQRVAARHGVTLDKEARAVLRGVLASRTVRGSMRHVLRRNTSRALRLVHAGALSLDIALALAAVVLFDRYVKSARTTIGNTLGPDEARSVRDAIDETLSRGLMETAKQSPQTFWSSFARAKEAYASSAGTKSVLKRLTDALVEGSTAAPQGLRDDLYRFFDEALRRHRAGAT